MFNQAIADLETVGGLLYDMLHVDFKTCIYIHIYIYVFCILECIWVLSKKV